MSEIHKAPLPITEEIKTLETAAATSKVVDQASGELTNDDLDNVSGGISGGRAAS